VAVDGNETEDTAAARLVQLLRGHGRHLATRFSAPAALLRTALHFWIARELLATGGARITDRCANATGRGMKLRTTQHEVGTGLADLCTVEQ
jgi:hypothetical protein